MVFASGGQYSFSPGGFWGVTPRFRSLGEVAGPVFAQRVVDRLTTHVTTHPTALELRDVMIEPICGVQTPCFGDCSNFFSFLMFAHMYVHQNSNLLDALSGGGPIHQ